jgi:hypothetical protein
MVADQPIASMLGEKIPILLFGSHAIVGNA